MPRFVRKAGTLYPARLNRPAPGETGAGPPRPSVARRPRKATRMRTFVVFAVLAALLAPGGLAQELKTDQDKTLYALGMVLGQKVAPMSLTAAELAIVSQGFTDIASGAKPKVELEQWGPKISEFAKARFAAHTEVEKTKGKAFLDEQAKKPGAQKTASGLIYFDEKTGTGPSPTAADKVQVHYRGTLIDGTEFDSSYKRNKPAEFPLNGVIACWTEGLQKMKVGGKAKLICPSSIAYGDNGNAGIPGGAALVFEVELLAVNPPVEVPPSGAAAPSSKPAPKPAEKPAEKKK
jgi:FKBP-type peptidyl-prolyl cis-trans isomerase FkpA